MDMNSMEPMSKVASNLIESGIKGMWNKVKQWFKDVDAKESIEYGIAYEEYLSNTYQKYSKIKTIIYRRVPKDLYSFYECIGIQCNGKTIDASDVNNIISKGNKLIITGSGGMGKSILLKHFYLNTIKTTEFIPVLIELRSFNALDMKDMSLEAYIYQHMAQNGFLLEKQYFEYSMSEGGYIILLDGFDELNRDKAAKVSTEIQSICDKYSKNKYIVTSRPSEQFIGWNDFVEMQTMSLTKEQALNLIEKIEFDEAIKKRFSHELEASLFSKYESFATNPLLLNIMLLTFNDHAYIPDKLNDFYDQAFATLFNMHDATKDAYVRDIRCKLGCEDFKYVFAYICFKSYFSSEYEFSEVRLREYIAMAKKKFEQYKFTVDDFLEDLTSSVCMVVKDGLNFHFSHRSFQEYFAAWYTCKLTDDTQAKLLTNWMKECESAVTDSYFTMLFNMQPEKVNKIILIPGLKALLKQYKDDGFSIKLLNRLFRGVRPRVFYKENLEKYKALSLPIKDRYKCSLLQLTCILNGYDFSEGSTETEEGVATDLMKLSGQKELSISFSKAIDAIGEERLLQGLKWLEQQLIFAERLVEQNRRGSIGNKKRVASILEEL